MEEWRVKVFEKDLDRCCWTGYGWLDTGKLKEAQP